MLYPQPLYHEEAEILINNEHRPSSEVPEGRCGNIVGQISHQLVGCLTKRLGWIKVEQIACNQFNIGIIASRLLEQYEHVAFDLDRDNTPGMPRQFLRQNASSCPNFQYLVIWIDLSRVDDCLQYRMINQKILPIRFTLSYLVCRE